MAKQGQDSFLEAFASTKLGRNDVLAQIEGSVRWYRFEKLLRRLRPDGAGRPPYDPLLMFKALLLQQWYALSDAELEEALNDRVSFRRFLGLGLEDDAPDHTTLCRFRNRLVEAGLTERLFAEFDKQMEERGLILKKGTMLDATLVAAATARPPLGTAPDEATDPDARFAHIQGCDAHEGGINSRLDPGQIAFRRLTSTHAFGTNSARRRKSLVNSAHVALPGARPHRRTNRGSTISRAGEKGDVGETPAGPGMSGDAPVAEPHARGHDQ